MARMNAGAEPEQDPETAAKPAAPAPGTEPEAAA